MATFLNSSHPKDDFWEFLKSRGIPLENINKMQQDHIDSSVVGVLDDAAMAVYIPAYGDRIATRRFCMDKQRRGEDDLKRLPLFEKLRRKMCTKSNKDNSEDIEEENTFQPTKSHLMNNKRALKMTRKIEMGWIHENRQVRKRCGGGTRVLDISKKATKTDIMSHAKKLFFPNDKSSKGMWEEFSHDVVDFQEGHLDERVSVGELYETHKLGIIRFYLFTMNLASEDEVFTDKEGTADLQTNEHPENTDQRQQTQRIENAEQEPQKTPDTEALIHMLEDDDQCATATSAFVSTPAVQIIDLSALCNTSEVIFGPSTGGLIFGELDDTLLIEEGQMNSDNFTSTPVHSEMVSAALQSSTTEALHVAVKLHRVTLLDELIAQFKDETIMSCSVKYSFIDEMGADVDGVSRDVYAAFWTEFLDCAAEGADMRVPSLSPRWQQEEWKSVGRILAKGLKDHGYFPSRLAQAFTAAVTFGEHAVSPDLLFDSLMLYLSQSERDLLSTALQNGVVGDEEEELLDLMDRMGVRTVPTQDNLKAVLLQVAHKQIIQQPKYALDNIAEVAGPTLKQIFSNVLEMQKMYEDLKPTTRKVLKLVTASPTSPAENQSLRFFHQYIRGLDEMGLRKLLRFVTGSDVICIKDIQIMFTSLEGLARRPIAHTCGPTLELPSTYNSFPELRVEMESVLSSNTYAMDIA